MLKVLVEIYPFGYETKKYTIEELYIANRGKDHLTGAYKYECWLNFDPRTEKMDQEKTRGVDILHNREDGAWKLIQLALEALDDYT